MRQFDEQKSEGEEAPYCFGGKDWYDYQAHLQLNQESGRGIRHGLDFCSILYLEARMCEASRTKKHMSPWLQRSLVSLDSVRDALGPLREYFKRMRLTPPVLVLSEPVLSIFERIDCKIFHPRLISTEIGLDVFLASFSSLVIMGVSGLLSALAPAMTKCHLSYFAGQRAGVDASIWLHRSISRCAWELFDNQASAMTELYRYYDKLIRFIRGCRVTPVLVFDGANLPAVCLFTNLYHMPLIALAPST